MRLMSMTSRRLVLGCWGLLLLIFGWLNLHVVPGGIVSGAILQTENPYVQAQQQVATVPGLATGDTLGLVLALPDGLNRASISQIRQISDAMAALLPAASVLSLTHNLNRYQSDEQSLSSEPYVPADLAALDLLQLKIRLQQNPLAHGTLLGGAQSEQADYQYAQILVQLPAGFSEQQLIDTVAEYLEQRRIHPLEWLLWKSDIKPVTEFANVSLSGWAAGRGLMHYALISDVLWYCTLGLCLATLAAWLALGSWRQALCSSAVILLSFVLVRGSIPLLDALGLVIGSGSQAEPVRERVYFLLVLSSLIVSGISLNTRALEAFNSAWRQAAAHGAAVDASQCWQALQPQLPRFNLVLGIAALNFLSLSQIGIRGVLEVGLLSALGLGYQRVLVSTLLPALQLSTQALPGQGRVQRAIQQAMAGMTAASVRFWLARSPAQALRQVLWGVLLLLLLVSTLVAHDALAPQAQRLIQVREKPIDYLPDTIVDRARQQLNQHAGGGFAQLSYFVSPVQVADSRYPAVADAEFVRAVLRLQQKLAALPNSRAVLSVVEQLELMQPVAGQSTAQLYDHLQLLRWDLADPRLADAWWVDQGLVLWLGHPADDSVSLRQYADAVQQLVAQEFPQLRLQAFGNLHSYHQTDLYISERKPLNTLLSVPMVLLLTACWFWYANQRLQQRRWSYRLSPLAAAAAVCLPFVLAYAVVLLVMALLQIPLDQATACATALGINAAIDFDLYLLEDFRSALAEGQSPAQALQFSIGQRGPLTLLDAGLNGIVFSFLLFSSFIPMQRLGLLMLVLLSVCACGALFVLPGVLRSCCRPASDRSA